jgi:hypothetical protein
LKRHFGCCLIDVNVEALQCFSGGLAAVFSILCLAVKSLWLASGCDQLALLVSGAERLPERMAVSARACVVPQSSPHLGTQDDPNLFSHALSISYNKRRATRNFGVGVNHELTVLSSYTSIADLATVPSLTVPPSSESYTFC